jgi:hypothetical protein
MEPKTMPGRPGAREAIGLGGWLRRLVGLFVFAVFPVLTAQLAMRQVEDLQVEQAIGLERLRHERWLGRLSAADNEGRMVSRSILRTFDAIRPLTDLRRRTALVRRLRRLFPGAFDLYFFDRDQQVIRDLSDSRHPARATSMAFGALRTYAAGETYDRGAMGILQSMLNMPTVLMAIKAARTPVKLAERDREGFLLWDSRPTPRLATPLASSPSSIPASSSPNARCAGRSVGSTDACAGCGPA